MRRWTSALTVTALSAAALSAVAFGTAGPAAAKKTPEPIYLNRHYTPVERATDLVSRMTLAEKAAQMDSSRPPAIARLGVAAWGWWNESNHGVNALTLTPTGNATTLTNTTSYPSDLSLGSTWNPNLVRHEASKIGDEARDVAPFNTENLDFYAPTVNLTRDPRWGRNDESWSEDPTLTADLASQYVDGLQGQNKHGVLPASAHGYYKAIATLKHYAANNSEVNRRTGSSDMDQRTLREYYTAQFASIIQQSHPGSIMSSYNEVNGTPAAANVQLMDTLARETFGFNGYFTSDCDAIYEIEAGHHWQPPQASAPLDQYGRTAFANSAGEDLDCNAGYADQYNYGNTIPTALAQHIQTQTDVYNQGDVDTSVVRLFTARIETGEFDAESDVPWVKAARKRLGGQTWVDSNANNAETETPDRLAQARTSADQSITLLKNNRPTETGDQKGSKLLPLKVPSSGPYKVAVMGYYAHPSGGLFLGGYSSIQGAAGQANNVDTYQGVKSAVQAIDPDATVDYLPGVTGGTTGSNLNTVDQASIAAASKYDAVIVVAGTDGSTSAEDHDRSNLELPGAQDSMISQAEAANPNTIVYLETVGDVNLGSFADTTPALLWSSYNGQEQGTAIADVLTGTMNPSGHLPFDWYTSDSDLPAITDYAIRPTATTQGRTYQYYTGPVSYPFGYGLSYSKFSYSDITLNHNAVTANGTITVKARVKNTGRRAGATVPQLYVTTPFEPASAQRPIKRLEAFQRVSLNPGQSKTVTFSVKAAKLAFFDESANKYVVDPGRYGLQVASSSSDVQLHTAVKVSGQISQTPAVLTAKPIETGDKARQVAERVMFDIDTTINPQLTVSMNDQKLYGYVTKGQSTPLPAGLTTSYRSDRSSVVRVTGNNTLKAVGSGIATVTATVRYHGGSATTSFTVDVAPLQITSDPSTVFAAGQPGSYTVTTNSSPTAKLTESGTLPAGVTFTDNGDGTATLAGTAPTKTGTYPITIIARNGVSPTVKQVFLLYVGKPSSLTSPSTAQFTAGSSGSFTVTTSGFPPTTLTESGTLPTGLTFTDNGDGTASIKGTPATGTQGSYPITVTAANGLSPAAMQTITVTVLAQAPTSTTADLAGTVSATMHYGTYTFSSPVAGIAVHLVAAGQSADAVPSVTTATNGSYEFDHVAPGRYQVEFVDPTQKYTTQWFNGTAAGAGSQTGASTVTLTAGQATVGVNATLATAGS
ncbi:glycoside hydrolase family 3 C-terminal domain-containing protein [Jatrophihabitans endophyticus]|uniref:glycoside hydrolase family 3 C-terminal domain-containing protein n=1 Tax=Jatrophihabitans endophyticus TaxID=1206085 RepID=UPI0019FAB6DD|nr:glycoside hydrolase family 3 C-terminal domain-containing protein [Jatrophihabitans endophyticus]MBE7187650.1 glycoside hydrolase family 3 C-terminal domain-containing protein [Jatrophihabitans endophyticus]